ncbi:isatin hydrolase-like [Mercenaria mercenaria]|uniref:isatin hydrolase-like n=1 Tax=Mercenaria mercenaria TaxID=6596 RepID=UPI00234EF447|nr:isatin hydrolase-like [Mercenaria mercenaria]XP_053374690.1 isatin hydrolase-like [Mercenaria mercenaria]XP_053374691.1 isatin hydrolase-like [Mercenaria mercenaria]
MQFEMFSTLLILAVSTGHLAHALDFKVVDLTHEQNPSTIYWPGNPNYNFTILFRNRTSKGYWYESNTFQTAEHGGTHLDSPAHFAEGKKRQHQIPMEKLVGPGVIVNVKAKSAENPDYRVTIDDLRAWESKYNRLPKGAVIIMNSGWSLKYPNKTLTFGTETPDDASTFHFPGWHEDTVNWLIKNRDVNVVGVDTPSTDYAQSTTFPVHVALGEADIPGVENVANLDEIPESGSIIYVAAIKLYDGSGGPTRVFATMVEDGMTGRSSKLLLSSVLYILSAIIVFSVE